MKQNVTAFLLGLILVIGLAACGQDASQSAGNGAGVGVVSDDGSTKEQNKTIVAQISDDFENALTPAGQLALGTLQLDDGDLAVSEAQAADLLPLWQAMQSLSNSDTTAQVELDAVAKQIEGAMTAEQVAAIAAMQLTEESLTETMDSGDLGLRGFGGRNADTQAEGDFPVPPDGGLGGFGGGPGGGFGGGPGGGAGGGPGAFANLSEDDIATRRAEFAENGLGDRSEQFLIGAVVRLMQEKTGEAPVDRGGLFTTVFEVVAKETGLEIDQIQAAMTEGQTLADVIEANGGDVAAVNAALVEAFEALPNAEEFDAQQMADNWLGQQ